MATRPLTTCPRCQRPIEIERAFEGAWCSIPCAKAWLRTTPWPAPARICEHCGEPLSPHLGPRARVLLAPLSGQGQQGQQGTPGSAQASAGATTLHRRTMSKTPKVVTEQIPPDYRELPEAKRKKFALRLAWQVRAGLGRGGTISGQLGQPRS
jgi:hypothetical protein